jgi:hypothetical protein
MQEFGGLESSAPGEGGSPASEQLSENAKQRFAQAQQQIKQIIKEEKKARKRDDKVADTIRQFLGDDKYAHLFQLISRLAARDCPSIFILALLSLIHEGSLSTVEEYIAENKMVIKYPDMAALLESGHASLPPEVQEKLLLWTSRLELVMSIDAEKILSRLMVDESNIDGSVLQFSTFILVDFFELIGQPIKILQDLLEPHVEMMQEYFKKLREQTEQKDEDE